MNFQVPQFIDVEDKVFGPLSFKQFLEIVGGTGLGYIIYTFEIIPFYIRLIPVILAVGFGLALAFYQVNGRPFIESLESGLKYYLSNHLYLWKKSPPKKSSTNPEPSKELVDPSLFIPQNQESKLKDLAWSLDVNEKIK